LTLILASSSPRRSDLLSRLNVPFEVYPSGIDERPPLDGEDPAAYALSLAREKAAQVALQHPVDVVLAADTVVELEGTFFAKPDDEADAARMLNSIRGKTHQVVTAVVACCGGLRGEGAVTSYVTMHAFDDDELRRYVATGEPLDKAGAYAVQGLGGTLVKHVRGCYNNVVGLPLCLTSELLRECGVTLQARVGFCAHT
jgi:septum formation protein